MTLLDTIKYDKPWMTFAPFIVFALFHIIIASIIRKSIKKLTGESEQLHELENDFDAFEREHNSQAQLETIKQEYDQEIFNLNAQVDNFEQYVLFLQDQLRFAQQETNQAKTRIQKIQAIARVKAYYHEKALAEVEDYNEILEGEINDLDSYCDSLQTSLDQARNHQVALRTERDLYRSAWEDRVQQVEEYQRVLSGKEVELATRRLENYRLRASLVEQQAVLSKILAWIDSRLLPYFEAIGEYAAQLQATPAEVRQRADPSARLG